MNDREFQLLLNSLSRVGENYRRLRRQAEEEYERRFGSHPSDVDDDMWIDFVEGQGYARPTVADVERGATEYAGLKRIVE